MVRKGCPDSPRARRYRRSARRVRRWHRHHEHGRPLRQTLRAVIGGRGRVRAAPALAAVVAVTLLVALPGAARAASDVQGTLLDFENHPGRIAIQNKGGTAHNLAGWKLLNDKP